jgi:hypothetical protein
MALCGSYPPPLLPARRSSRYSPQVRVIFFFSRGSSRIPLDKLNIPAGEKGGVFVRYFLLVLEFKLCLTDQFDFFRGQTQNNYHTLGSLLHHPVGCGGGGGGGGARASGRPGPLIIGPPSKQSDWVPPPTRRNIAQPLAQARLPHETPPPSGPPVSQ